jgi:uncharacterized membrane protein YgcG
MRSAIVALALVLAASPTFPDAEGRCVDETGVLNNVCDEVTDILRDESLAVAVVSSIEDTSIEKWSAGLFRHWDLPADGTLLVVAVDDNRAVFRTGDTAKLDDLAARRIITEAILPRLADGDYSAGILGGLDQARRRLGHRIPAGAELASLAAPLQQPIQDPDDIGFEAGPNGELIPVSGDLEEDDGAPAWLVSLVVVSTTALLLFGAARRLARR